MIKIIERALRAAGIDAQFYWRNTSKEDGEGELPIHGSAMLRVNDRLGLRFAWDLWSRFAHVGASIEESEGEITLRAALPPVALWLSAEGLYGLLRGKGDREWKLSAHDGAIWWSIGYDERAGVVREGDWRHGNFDVVAALLGEQDVLGEPLRTVDAMVPLHDGLFPAKVSFERVVMRRRRFPSLTARESIMATVEIDAERLKREGRRMPEFPGKGESAWDLDDDAIYKMSARASTVAEAVGEYAKAVMSRREQRAGRIDWTRGEQEPPAQSSPARPGPDVAASPGSRLDPGDPRAQANPARVIRRFPAELVPIG